MKILIAVSTYPEAPHVHPFCWESIQGLRWKDPYEITLLMSQGKNLRGVNKIQSSSEKFMRAQAVFLAGDWDALLTVEADNIIPPGALEKMATVDADIIYGLYCSRTHKDHVWMLRRGERIGLTGVPDRETMRAAWNQVAPSDGIGTGCTLIHRRVLEEIEFIWTPGLGHDWHFAKEAKARGFRQVHDCRVHVGHLMGSRMSVWPDPETTYKVRR